MVGLSDMLKNGPLALAVKKWLCGSFRNALHLVYALSFLSLEFTCGTESSVVCMRVTHAPVTTGARLFLSRGLLEQFDGTASRAVVG